MIHCYYSSLISGDVDKAYSYRFLFFLTKSSIIKFTIDLPEPHELTKRVSRKDENDPTKDLIETKTCSIGKLLDIYEFKIYYVV